MTGDEIRRHHRTLPKGHIRESRTATTVGYDPIDADGDTVSLDTKPVKPVSASDLAPPREVAEEIYGLVWQWAKQSRENFQLMARIVRHNNPASFGHLSDDELATKIEQHAKDAARKAAETVYSKGWDRGNDLDQAQGKPVTP